ncbi:hypothetical protein FRC07_010769 [Ceratobasidium sp. 392]|nr:hypothetical protein FRC07_010769 [Ceratobasidium sp. 392]
MSGFKRSINSVQIPQAQRAKLMKNGYTTVADILAVSSAELSKDLGLSLEDAASIIAAANPSTQSKLLSSDDTMLLSASQRTHVAIGGSQTAAALLRVPASATALSLGVKAIDELLDGGALKGCVTEICGVPGSGRAAAVMSVFASAIRAGHEVLVVEQFERTTYDKEAALYKGDITTRTSVLYFDTSSILCYHVQTSAITPQIRSKVLNQIKQQITKTCATGQTSIVATTSMATKLVDDEGQPANFSTGTKALLVPSLGDAFSLSSKTYRIVLARQPYDGQRYDPLFHPYHSPSFQVSTPTGSALNCDSADGYTARQVRASGRFARPSPRE